MGVKVTGKTEDKNFATKKIREFQEKISHIVGRSVLVKEGPIKMEEGKCLEV